jgi:hypothetical protein
MDSFQHVDATRHEYGIKTWLKMFYLLIGIMLIVFSAVGCVTYAYAAGSNTLALLMPLIFIAVGIYVFALASRSRLVIEGTRIQVQHAFREQSAEVSGIEGFRTVSSRSGSIMQILLKDGLGTISVPSYFDTDDFFRKWTAQITDLDKTGRDALLEQISRQEDLGATPEERLQALPTARTWGVFLLIVSIAAVVALFVPNLVPRLPVVVILALVPAAVILLVLRSPLLYTVFKPKSDPRAELSYALMASSFGLIIPIGGLHLVSMQPLMFLMVPVGLAYSAALYFTAQNNAPNAGKLLLLLMLAGFYSYSLSVAADTLEDSSQVTRYTASVIGKRISSGRSRSYILLLAPWGPVEKTNQISVSYTTYNQTVLGDQVCLNLHAGLLHVPWYQQVSCSY